MKVVITPIYEPYRTLIESLPTHGFTAQHIFCQHRNLVAVWQMGEYKTVVKRYKRPTWANCFIYTFFRKNKAQRAYENAQLLLSHGFESPEPIAYIVIKRYGLVHTCYFISAYLPWATLQQADAALADETDRLALWKSYMEFARDMHSHRLFLRDNNSSNILVDSSGNRFRFALVDINRLQSNVRPQWPQLVTFFYQLGLPLERLLRILPYYRSMSEERKKRFVYYYAAFDKWRKKKHRIKQMLRQWFVKGK